ncbi:AraC family transcriptional regulator [Fulvivirgaceae bacterium PWU4]|uniref:AraC family transcriptional regulator n=1 Tax=Chryseosolibacter histidini TaxID=2782349 RepID=A0AAP2GNZ2_9BACT|nr:AraC family transcriptional regulator [Chryseosolibacter histidini]MBT1698513.1 AraC family transcriptional regulator [Chryseosolibacter histidini]
MNLNTTNTLVPLTLAGLADPLEKDKLGFAYLSHASRTVTSATTFSIAQRRDFIGLHFNLGARVHYTINGKSYSLRPQQYALVCVPTATYQCTVAPGRSETFSIHLSVEYLQRLEAHFPILSEMLKSIREQQFFSASEKILECTTDMRKKINEILHNDWTGICWQTFMNVRVLEILLECLNNIAMRNTKQLTRHRLELVRKYLIDHLQDRFSADAVAGKMKIDKHKLRKDFKAMYNVTMQQFVLEERMKRARAFLRDSKLPVSEIAASIGYKKLSHFNDLFKKRYGYPPSHLR